MLIDQIHDREMEIFESSMMHELCALDVELEDILSEYDSNYTLFENTSDYDEMYQYLTEAKKVQKKSQGILSRLCQAIKALFRKVMNWITGKKENLPERGKKEVKVSIDPKNMDKLARKVISSMDMALAVGTVVSSGIALYTTRQRNQMKQTMDQATSKNKSLESEKLKLKSELDNATSKNKSLESKQALSDGKINALQNKIKEDDEELKSMKEKMEKKSETLTMTQRNALDQYEKTLKMCDEKIDEIKDKLNNISLTPKAAIALSSEFNTLRDIASLTRKAIDEILSTHSLSADNKKKARESLRMHSTRYMGWLAPQPADYSTPEEAFDGVRPSVDGALDWPDKKRLIADGLNIKKCESYLSKMESIKKKWSLANDALRKMRTLINDMKEKNSPDLKDKIEKYQELAVKCDQLEKEYALIEGEMYKECKKKKSN